MNYTIAVYRKKIDSAQSFVGVFENGLEKPPCYELEIKSGSEVSERAVSAYLKEVILGQEDSELEIDFFEGLKIVKTKKWKKYFIKTTPYFSPEFVMEQLKNI